MVEFIVVTGLSTFFAGLAYKLLKKKLEDTRRADAIKNYASYNASLQHAMEKSYEIVYRDKMLVYSIEGMKMDDAKFNAASRDFIVLTLKLLGPTLSKELEYLFGNKDTLYFNIVEHFNSKFEDDEIRKSARERMMEGDSSGV